jgi:predicted transposase YbfD/YdcC
MLPSSASFFDHFDPLEDPRIERCRRHNLRDIVFIAVCAFISGANDFVGMEKFGRTCRTWLAKFVELPNGIPSHDTFGRVFAAVDAEQFVECFLSWAESIHQVTAGELINIDGKTVRASVDKAKGQNPLHVVSAWATANRLTLGQVMVDEKSNEITAIPKLLELLEIQGAIVTIDAMGCQKDIAAQIRAGEADYVLAVKGNQEHLEEDIINHFERLDEGVESNVAVSRYATNAKDHGRQEQRYYQAVPVPDTLRNLAAWPDLRSIARATRVWQENGVEKSEVRYFISSLAANAKVLGEAIRGHWGIENGLHWVLDMYFGEDRSRARTEHAAANLATLRRWILSLLRQNETLTGSFEKKRLQAAWDKRNLEQVLGLS